MTPERYELVSGLFSRAVALEPGPREALLEEACAGDPSLRKEVEEWLVNDERARKGGFFEGPSPLAEWIPLPPEPPDPMIGRRIGAYEVNRRIGSGGMGDVYLAVRRDGIKLRVAIKVVRRGTDSQAVLQRFRNERQILAALQHAHIARFIDGGAAEDGSPYFVMEYIEGKPIDAYCDRNRLTTRQRLELFQAVCAAVHFAHQHGVIHRDLSPDNIRVTEDGVPKLLDFGIAKLTNPDLGFAPDEGPTGHEHQLMKPEYASPEQVRGEPVTTASDVYSLGVVLYRLLTGHPPYRFGSRARRDVELTVCEAEPEAPSTIVMRPAEVPRADGTVMTVTPEEVSKVRDGPPAKLRRSLAGEVDKIVLMALKKEHGRRFQSVEQLAEDIRRHLEGLPLLWAVKDTLLYRTRKFIQRNRVLVAAAALIVLSLLGGVAGTTAALFRAWDAEAEANKRTEDAVKAEVMAVAEQEKTQRALADLLLHKAFDRCGRGEVGPGMLLLVRALDAAVQGKAPDLERVIRVNLAAWCRHLDRVPPPFRHPQGVDAVAFNPDGRRALTGGADGTARLWDVADGREVGRLQGHRGAVRAVAFSSPDGRLILTGSEDNTARLWNLAGGELRRLEHPGPVHAVAFSPDGRRVLTGGADGTARLWDVADGREVGRLQGHRGAVRAVAFRPPDGRLILTGSEDNTARLWDPAGGELRRLEHPGPVHAVAFSPPDGKTFVTAGAFKSARLWRLRETAGPDEVCQSTHQGYVNSISFRPDGKALLVGNTDRSARFWHCEGGKSLSRPLPHGGEVKAVAFHPSGEMVMTGSGDGVARLWKTGPNQFPFQSLPHDGPVHAVDINPVSGAVLTGGAVFTVSGAMRLWDPVRGGRLLQLPARPHRGAVGAIAFSRDGKSILSGSRDGSLRLWEAATGENSRTWLKAHDGIVTAVAFSPDGQTVLSGSADGTAALWQVADGERLHLLQHTGGKIVWTVAFSPDGKTVLSASADGTARLWDANTGCERSRLDHGEGVTVRAAVFSPDGGTVLTGSSDGKARIWDPVTGGFVLVGGHSAEVVVVAFSPDGKTALTGSMDGSAQLSDTGRGKPIGRRLWHGGPVTAAAFSPDGGTALTGTDHAGYFWDAATGLPLGPPLPHSDRVSAVAFGPGGTMAVTGSHDKTARLWKVPAIQAGDRERIRLWIQVTTGLEWDENGDPQELASESWRQRRRRLEELQPQTDR
jgi:WD40 repeat protein/serine/threonine protein kinase